MRIIDTRLCGIIISMVIYGTSLCTQEAPMYLYKIVSPEQWQQSQAQQTVTLTDFDEAFIHLAQEHQIEGVLQKFWADKPYLVLILDSTKLIGNLVLESNRPCGDRYYHLYNGSIPLMAVMGIDSRE